MRRAILLSKRITGRLQNEGSSSKEDKNPMVECSQCGALVWTSESTRTDCISGELKFTICCSHGQIKLPPIKPPPPVLDDLLTHRWFRHAIRVYYAVFAFTSIGAKLDYSVVYGPCPFTFRIQGQTHHRIGSLLLFKGRPPKYLQLYIVDTNNEVSNRLKTMGQTSPEGTLDETIIKSLIDMMDEHNCLATNFGKDFTISLLPDKQKRKEYDLPTTDEVAGIIVGDMSSTIGHMDIVVQFQSETLHQLRDDHPLYMSLQYPLLFPYGEYDFEPKIPLHLEAGTSRTRQYLTIRQYYAYQIHTRLKEGMTLIKGGRLLHQYVVDIYTTIEEDRLRSASNNQHVLKADLYNNIVDVVGNGDTDAKAIGQRFILPSSFIGGPCYLIKKYHDAMAICREFGNPDLFITMTVNPNWKEIKEHLTTYRGDSPNDRPDIECRKFLRPYSDYTSIEQSGYVLYRRRRDENAFVLKDGVLLNNTSVIPHNIELLKKYEAHINVEWCNRTSAVKYLFKYITKGVDKANNVIEKGNTFVTPDKADDTTKKQRNEIQDYI
ncbi:hypothetical protein N665_0077s0005 [Sinapis alba]|nr:hypothetical protein N665_0077s0005 [Sinapis alba]